MSDSYGKVKGGRLTFKGGILATTSKTIEKNKKKKKKNKKAGEVDDETQLSSAAAAAVVVEGTEDIETGVAGEVYTIDAAKRLKYEELFPVETKRFGYHGKAEFKSLEDALDDRVKKKADRYCK
ncbi:uncharacterized protein [Euphorbia lathyris]|uniref:uncharacterized protein n=1 Tax=Euphorbia lathyris TaxID=212925 RepID=UPI003313785D